MGDFVHLTLILIILDSPGNFLRFCQAKILSARIVLSLHITTLLNIVHFLIKDCIRGFKN